MVFLRVFLVLLAATFFIACSNDDDDRKGQGDVTFLHLITDASQVRVESDSRNYGEYYYEQFGFGQTYTEGGYSVTLVERDLLNPGVKREIGSGSFTVGSNRLRVSVLHGQIENASSENTVAMTTVRLAYDSDQGRSDNDDVRYVNVSNFFDGTNSETVTIYLQDDLTSDYKQTAHTVQLAFGETSETFELDRQLYTLVVEDSTGTEIYNSGQKAISDQLEQGIIVANYAGLQGTPEDSMKAYYIGSNAALNEDWGNQNSSVDGYVKVVNTLIEKQPDDTVVFLDIDQVDVYATSDPNTIVKSIPAAASATNYGFTSIYEAFVGGEYFMKLTIDGVASETRYYVTVDSDEAKNVSFYGYYSNASAQNPKVTAVDKRDLSSVTIIEFQNFVTQLPTDNLGFSAALHVVRSGQIPSLATEVIPAVVPGATVSFAVALEDASTYELVITETGAYSPSLAAAQITNDETMFAVAFNSTGGGIELKDMAEDIP